MTKNLSLFIASLCLIPSAFAAPASPVVVKGGGDQPLVGCEARIQKTFQFPIAKLKNEAGQFPPDRINEKTPITEGRAYSYYRLVSILPTEAESLPAELRDSCLATGHELRAQLDSYFERRFRLLLSQGDLSGFYAEYQAVLSNWGTRSERKAISDRFSEAESTYLNLSLKALKAELLATRWADYAGINPSLERWSPEWARLLGGEAPGAVLFYAQRIAIQAAELDPQSLRIVLFHELSHLADPRLRTPEGRGELTTEQAETFAWGQTMDYLSYLGGEGFSVPDRFLRDQEMVQKDGLTAWVEAIVASLR